MKSEGQQVSSETEENEMNPSFLIALIPDEQIINSHELLHRDLLTFI